MIRLMTILFALCLTVATSYLVLSRKSKNDRSELYHNFRKVVSANLHRNIEKLQKGDLVWRRLGHGQAAIGLKKTAPHRGGVVPVSLESVAGRFPDIVKKIKSIDARLENLQAAANRLASAIEEPVREQFQDDRRRLADQDDESVRPFRRWLLNREDAWMELLANLVNNGHTLTKESDPATLYWRHSAPSYHAILERHGDAELKELEQLRSELAGESIDLLNVLELGAWEDRKV